MKQLNLLRTWLLLLCLALSTGVTWGEDVVYKTALFGGSYNSKGVSSYTGSFSATNDGFTVDLVNFNNNNNGWSFVKTGNKTNASVGTITTNAAIDKAITKVVVTIDAVTASSVNSITLYSGTSANSCTTSEGTFTVSTGAQNVAISSPSANKFYKISFDCKKGSSNGLVTVSKVEYYVENSATPVAVTGVNLDKTSIELVTGKTAKLTATVAPSNATNQNVTWSSNNETVATVEDGVVTAVAEGNATITVTTEDGNHTATCEVTVTPTVQTYANTYTSGAGLLDTFDGTQATEAIVKWGDVEYGAIKAGTSKVSGAVKVKVPAGTKKLHIHIAGWNSEGKEVTVSGLTSEDRKIVINPDSGIAGSGTTFTLSLDPEAKHYYVIETNNDEEITITITATTGNRFVLFGVNAEAGTLKTKTSLSWSVATATVEYGAENPTFPTLATDPEDLAGVTYSSSNTNVASISEDGDVTINGVGSTTITASYSGNETYAAAKDASYTLTVTKVLERIVLSGTYKTEFTEGEVFTHDGLVVTAYYNDGSNEDVTAKATFSEPNMNTMGEQTVTVTYEGKTAQYTITVKEAIKYTVKFDAQGGTCDTESLTETSYDSGVTLPSATCNNSEWSFAGWATEACEETTTAPTLYKANTTYNPTADVTLYAVYMTGAEEGEIAFNRVTDISQIKNGDKVVVVHNTTNYVMTLSSGDNTTVENANTITMTAVKKIWNVTIDNGVYTFKDSQSTPKTLSISGVPRTSTENIASVGNLGSSNNSYKYADWTVTPSDVSNCWVITNTYTTDNGSAALTVNSTPQWGVLNVNDSNGPRDPSVFAMRIYVEGTTTSATYNSNPVAQSLGGTITFVANDGEGNYYATFSSDQITAFPIDSSNDVILSVEAVYVDNDGEITKTDFYNDFYSTNEDMDKVFVPANTGVLLHAFTTENEAPSVNYEITNVESEIGEYDPEFNMLVPCTTTGIYKAEADGNYYYKLAYGDYSDRTDLGFWWGADDGSGNFKVKAGHAILCVPQNQAQTKGFGFNAMDDTNAIEMIESVSSDDVIYNLQGIRLNSLQKGINIINGRKVIR